MVLVAPLPLRLPFVALMPPLQHVELPFSPNLLSGTLPQRSLLLYDRPGVKANPQRRLPPLLNPHRAGLPSFPDQIDQWLS